jgi:hypothetical protein
MGQAQSLHVDALWPYRLWLRWNNRLGFGWFFFGSFALELSRITLAVVRNGALVSMRP